MIHHAEYGYGSEVNGLETEELISKKELLTKYGISYGALYRWKRMGLIPEDWFLKKAVASGQETFFPKARICERIELIQSRKDDQSLQALADELAGKTEQDAFLILSSIFGKKTFALRDLQSVELLCENGKTVELTDLLQKIRNEAKSET